MPTYANGSAITDCLTTSRLGSLYPGGELKDRHCWQLERACWLHLPVRLHLGLCAALRLPLCACLSAPASLRLRMCLRLYLRPLPLRLYLPVRLYLRLRLCLWFSCYTQNPK